MHKHTLESATQVFADATSQPASFTEYEVGSDAYIRVHVSNGPRPDGSILVYLTNGTALVVNDEELLHLDTAKNAPSASD